MTATPVDPSKYPDDAGPDVRNDSSMSTRAVMAKLKADGVEIMYGELCMLAERRMLDQARDYVGTLPGERRQQVMRSVDAALRKYKPKVLKGTASKKRMDNFHTDLLLWTALKEASVS